MAIARHAAGSAVVLLVGFVAVAGAEGRVALVPQPARVAECAGSFRLDRRTVVEANRGAAGEAERLASWLRRATGLPLPLRVVGTGRLASRGTRDASTTGIRSGVMSERPGAIVVARDARSGDLGPEGYRLEVSERGVRLSAATAAGLFYGVQTLRQLLPPQAFAGAPEKLSVPALPCVAIEDRPRFRWRGAMLDVSRHFLPKEFVLRFLDLLALHKMNRFHWHLTDDQGWRIEIRKYPLLTQVGGFRAESPVRYLADFGFINFFANSTLSTPEGRPLLDGTPHGGFYTQSEIREVVAYARERHIEIVPEIDMPGHIQAAIAAYPELGNTGRPIEVATEWGIHEHTLNVEEETVAFVQDVLAEVIELFPGRFVHLGGDEVLTGEWEQSRAAQRRIAELGLASAAELRGWFLSRMVDFLHRNGRRAIGWNEIFEGDLDRRVAILSWIGTKPGVDAALAGHEVVMGPIGELYFDHVQGLSPEARSVLDEIFQGRFDPAPWLTPLEQVYAFEPIPPELRNSPAAARILGAQAQLWTEFMHDGAEVEERAFPRLSALAEVVWSAPARRDFADFERRLSTHLKRLEALDVAYYGR